MLKTRHRERELIDACLKVRQPLVVDNTNLTEAEREIYIDKARQAGFQVVGCYFKTDLSASLARNDERNGKQRVPRPAILSAHGRLQLPTMQEGFDRLFYVRADGEGCFTTEAWQEHQQ